MPGQDKKMTIEEKAKIRGEISPILERILEKLDNTNLTKIEPHIHIPDTVNSVHEITKYSPALLKSLQGILEKALSVVKFPSSMNVRGDINVVNKDVQKVEGEVGIKGKVKVEVSRLEDLIKSLLDKELKIPDKQKVEVEGLVHGEMKTTNLPIGKGKEVNKTKANPSEYLVVRLADGEKFLGMPGTTMSASSGPSMEKVWLREEYTYTTVSGVQVPSTVIKWDDQFKMKLDYAYDGNANPTTMTRSIEPSAGVGQ